LRYAQIAISNVLVKVPLGRAWSTYVVSKKDPSLLASSLFAKGDFDNESPLADLMTQIFV